jgi:hypothetical protein
VIAPAAAASRLRGHDTYGTEHWENIGKELSATGFQLVPLPTTRIHAVAREC